MPRRDRHYQEPEQVAQAQAPYAYTPFMARLGAADQDTFQQPVPKNPGWFMTFWQGNQLPGITIETAPSPAQNYRYREQHSAQRDGGAFGGGWLNSVKTFTLLERMRAAWASQSGF